MPQERLSMRKISEVLRLKHAQKLSNRKIAKCCNVGRATVASYIARAHEVGITWPLPEDMTALLAGLRKHVEDLENHGL